MNFVEGYSHRNGNVEWEKRELHDWIKDVFNAPSIEVKAGSTTPIREHVRHELTKDDLAIQLQAGNISRAFYDLLKLQYMFQRNKIEAATLAVPTKLGAQRIGSNIANFERICAELQLYDRVITVPLLVIAFE
jgi:hypothetical protein